MMEDWALAWRLLPQGLGETLYMVGLSTLFALLLGFPVGLLLTLVRPGGFRPRPALYRTLALLVNAGRSFPFAILAIFVMPFTRWVVGSSIGTTATLVPLTLAALPFVARVVEGSLCEVSCEAIEAAFQMGSTLHQVVWRIWVPEALPGLLRGITLTAIALVGYSAMAGLIGGGGLGQVAIQYGYNRFNPFIMTSTVVLFVLLVQLLQFLGDFCVIRVLKKRGLR